MQRRQLLKGIAAGSALTVGVGSAAGRRPASQRTAADLDAVRVVRRDEVVQRVENPSEDDLARLFDDVGEEEYVSTPDDCEIVECCSDCYNCCMCGTYC